MGIFLKFVLKGLRRRKTELTYVSTVTFIAVLFLSSVTLFQNCMDRYLMETNYQNYGDWVLSAVKDNQNAEVSFSELSHPYLESFGICKTGAEILHPKDTPSGIYLGTLDDSLRNFGNISLYEGRFPAAKNEIAMDLSSLSALGYSYDLGQTIHVTLRTRGNVVEQTFLLVGMTKSFAENWKQNSRYPLPNGIVTEECMEQIGAPLFETYFYHLNRAYENLDLEEFASAFLLGNNVRTYNSYVYENRIWGSRDLFLAVKLVLAAIGALAVGYLMMSYVSQRRKWYYKLRCFGADKLQIKLLIFTETAYGTLPYALLALLLPYCLGAALCAILSYAKNLPYFFVFQRNDFFLQLLSSLGILLFAMLCAFALSKDKNLGKNKSEITKRQLRRLRRDARKEQNVGAIFFKRQRKLHPFQRTARILFATAACFVLLLCLNQMFQAFSAYRQAKEEFYDFQAEKRKELTFTTKLSGTDTASSTGFFYDMYDGASAQTEAEIQSLIGIETVHWQTNDELHLLQWEDKKDSPIEQRVSENYKKNIVQLPTTKFLYYEDCGEILRELKKDFRMESFDEQAFYNGESVILMLSPFEDASQGGEKIFETTIHTGDMAEIVSLEAQSSVPLEIENHEKLRGRTPVKVGMVVTDLPLKWKWKFDFLCNYGILASQKLAERVAKTEQKTLFHNKLSLTLNANQSFESTQKRLASIFEKNEMAYSSESESLQQARTVFIRKICIYGTLFCTILLIFLLLSLHFCQIQNLYQRRERLLLKRLGMEDSFFYRLTRKESFLEAVWMLLGIPLCYGILALQIYMDFQKEKETVGLYLWSDTLGDFTPNPLYLTLDQMQSYANPIIAIAFTVLLILGFVRIANDTAKKEKEKEYERNITGN